jgi:hypothetical protein
MRKGTASRSDAPAKSPLLWVVITANHDSLHRKKIEGLDPRGSLGEFKQNGPNVSAPPLLPRRRIERHYCRRSSSGFVHFHTAEYA